MISKQQTPKIRFTGFSEDWSNLQFFETLDSIVDFRGRTPKKIGLEWSDKGYVALSALNVKNGYIDFSLNNHFGDEELYQKWMGGKELVAGQVLFTTEAPMGNVAQVPDNKGYILSQRTIAFNTDSSVITNDFLAVLLRSPATFNRLDSMTSGGTAKGVSQKSMAKLEVDIPADLQEQTAIGNLFQNIDQTIALQRRKYEQTQTLKKSLLSEMFPKRGQRQPEIRLIGFSGDWAEVKLEDVVEIVGGGTPDTNNPHFWNGDIDWYSPTEIGKKVYADKSVKTITELGLLKSSAQILPANETVLFTSRAGIGDMAILRKNGATNQGFQSFIAKDIDVYFLYSMGSILKEKAMKKASGSTFLEISKNQLKVIELLIPSNKSEQTAIGQFFKQLDDTLSLQAKQLKTLDNLKQALLAKMFV